MIVEILNRQNLSVINQGKYWNIFYVLYLVFINLERGKLLVFILFTIIGILNELFQNYLLSRGVLGMVVDS